MLLKEIQVQKINFLKMIYQANWFDIVLSLVMIVTSNNIQTTTSPEHA